MQAIPVQAAIKPDHPRGDDRSDRQSRRNDGQADDHLHDAAGRNRLFVALKRVGGLPSVLSIRGDLPTAVERDLCEP